MKEYTLLIQGKINDECFNLWIENYKDFNVVVSVWNDEDMSKYAIPKNWELVLNTYPNKRFMEYGNLDYQIITTLNGLSKVNTEFVIKVRADEYWSNLNIIHKKAVKNPNKIVSSSMFFRRWGMYYFHCGDKILAGKTKNIQLMFETASMIAKQNVLNTKVPETYLGLGYVVGLGDIVFDDNFILSLNNKNVIFEESNILYTLNKAYKAIKSNFNSIFQNSNKIEIETINKSLEYSKEIIQCCIEYNEDVLKFKNLNHIDDKPIMRKHFEIIDINKLKPYIATRNLGESNGRMWYRSDFDNRKENCLANINLD